MDLRVKGLYDLQTFNLFKSQQVKSFGFDLVPLSFNFIQCYQLVNILQKESDKNDLIYLQFKDDKDFVIKSILDEVQYVRSKLNNVFLEFKKMRDVEFMEKFQIDYVVHISSMSELKELLKAQKLKGISLDKYFLDRLQMQNAFGEFFDFLEDFEKRMSKQRSQPILIELNSNWNDSLEHSIYDFFNINQVCLEINSQVEEDYRQVNAPKVISLLNSFQKNQLL
ncbi:hypothetical protein N9N67_08590 [Bacteriovoracaceae bacterium]|nr:hypothetical protein [Bacteriovoracaceae bacterium]